MTPLISQPLIDSVLTVLLQKVNTVHNKPQTLYSNRLHHVLQRTTIVPTRCPALCEAPSPNSVIPNPSPKQLLQNLTEFCTKYSIPDEYRPLWLTQGDYDILRFGIPLSSPIYDIISSLAEYRSQVNRHFSQTDRGIFQTSSTSVAMESRNVAGQSKVRLIISPQDKHSENTKETSTVIEVTSPILTESGLQIASVDLKKPTGLINNDDINTVQLALYLGHIKTPKTEESTLVNSKSINDPFEFLSSRLFLKDKHPSSSVEDVFFNSIQSSFFGPDIFSIFGSFPNGKSGFDDQSLDLGRPENIIDWRQRSNDSKTMNTDGHRIKKKLESMGTKVYLPSDEREKLDWNDLAGYEDAKRLIEESLLLGLTHPEVFNQVTAKTRGRSGESSRPRLILFNGPPGTGKTSTARIIASQVKLPLIYVSLECIVSKWFGESERNLGEIFDHARLLGQIYEGCVIFVDEIDSLAGSRDDLTSHEASRRILSILLRRLDGFDTQHDKTILVCATNRERDLDEAFRSRVDVTVMFPLPDYEGRAHIIKRYAKHLSDEEVDQLVQHTNNLSGRNIRDLCQIAERRWVAHFLRESGTVTSVADSTPSQTSKASSTPVNFAVSPPPVEFYLAAAEQKQIQQR